MPREQLYKNIDGRVDQLVAEGVLDEAKKFYQLSLDPSSPAITGIGYRQFFPYFEGKISLEEALRLLKRDTRHYAKRQLTWYRKYGKKVAWVSDYEEAESLVEKFVL